VISGRTGGALFTFTGSAPQEDFGRSVCGGGDVDGDGWPDLVVGAPHDDDGGLDAGSVSVISGRDGSRIHFCLGDTADDHLGWSVAGGADADGDGRPDFAAGSWGHDANGSNSGLVRLYSGATGAVIRDALGSAPL